MFFRISLKLLILLLILNISQTLFALKINNKKRIANSNKWASEWFQKNKNELILMTDQQLKFKLRKELAKYSQIDQKTFIQISKIVLNEKKTLIIERKQFKDRLYSIRMGK